MSEQDADASEVHEAEEVLRMALVAGDESPIVLKPREEPLEDWSARHANRVVTRGVVFHLGRARVAG